MRRPESERMGFFPEHASRMNLTAGQGFGSRSHRLTILGPVSIHLPSYSMSLMAHDIDTAVQRFSARSVLLSLLSEEHLKPRRVHTIPPRPV